MDHDHLDKKLNLVKKAHEKTINIILEDIYNNFIKENDKSITLNDFKERYIKQKDTENYQCTTLLSNLKRCSFKSIKETNYLYCKRHINKNEN